MILWKGTKNMNSDTVIEINIKIIATLKNGASIEDAVDSLDVSMEDAEVNIVNSEILSVSEN